MGCRFVDNNDDRGARRWRATRGLRVQASSERDQVEADDARPYVTLESIETSPGAAFHLERALQGRDAALDARAKVAETFEDPRALDHVVDLKTALLVKRRILHAEILRGLQVLLRGEAAVEA